MNTTPLTAEHFAEAERLHDDVTIEALTFYRNHGPQAFRELAETRAKLEQCEAGAAALRKALEIAKVTDLSSNPHLRKPIDAALATTAGADILAKLAKAEAEMRGKDAYIDGCKESLRNTQAAAVELRDERDAAKTDLRIMKSRAETAEGHLSKSEAERDALSKALEAFPFREAIIQWTEENWEMPKVQREIVADGLGSFLAGAIAALSARKEAK